MAMLGLIKRTVRMSHHSCGGLNENNLRIERLAGLYGEMAQPCWGSLPLGQALRVHSLILQFPFLFLLGAEGVISISCSCYQPPLPPNTLPLHDGLL